MKTIAYYPKRRILTVLDENGCAEISYTGDAAEHKFFEALVAEDVNVSIVGGSFKIKGKPADRQSFVDALANGRTGCKPERAMQTIIIKRK